MNQIVEHLSQPEYMHVLINPMPVYGLSMGIVAMVIALISRGHEVGSKWRGERAADAT